MGAIVDVRKRTRAECDLPCAAGAWCSGWAYDPDALREADGDGDGDDRTLGAAHDGAAVDRLRAVLNAALFSISVREKRECSEGSCTSEALVEWNHPSELPSGWYSNRVCGKHSYRTCGKCESLYVMSSTNAVGQAPSIHCAVCGEVIVEWGSSKMWSAELV